MTREQIKEELLNNEQQQTNIIINAQFMALYAQLTKKGLFSTKDIEEMNEFTNKYIDMLNEKVTDRVMEELNKEE